MFGKLKRILLLLWLLTLTGCWDVQEIRNRGITNAVFFDIENPEKIIMGIVGNIPGTLAPTNVGTYQQFQKRSFVLTAQGTSLVKAWTEIQANAAQDIFFGQTRAVILSERLARKNINDYLDFIGRIPLVPPNTVVLVAKEDPKKLMDLKNLVNLIPGTYFDLYFRNPSKRSLAIPIDLWRVNAIIDRQTGDPYIPFLSEMGGNYKIAGTAVFSRNHLVGELNKDETECLAWLKGTDNSYLTVSLGNKEYVGFKNIRAKTSVRPRLTSNGKISFELRTKMSGNLVETFPHRGIRRNDKKRIERIVSAMIRKRLHNLIVKLQGYNSDPVGFGGKVRIKYPHQWKQMDWHRIYPTAQFKISAKFTLKETGLYR